MLAIFVFFRFLISLYKTHLNLIKKQCGQIGREIGSGDSNLIIPKGYEISRKGSRGRKGWRTFLNFTFLETSTFSRKMLGV
jgi:hypothetical protein